MNWISVFLSTFTFHKVLSVIEPELLIPYIIMKSQWFEYKEKAIELRKQGFSYGEIVQTLSIPKSTLSHWLRHIELSDQQKLRLEQNYGNALIKARAKSVIVRQKQRELRLQNAKDEAEQIISDVEIDDNLVELALAMLYLGEGAKKNTTAIGNSNPLILKFFIAVLRNKYGLEPGQIRCELHLRADQKPEDIKRYWSKELNLPLTNFRTVVFDKRTIGKTTYPSYKGVCIVNCGNIAIQRKLIYLYNQFCQRVIDEWAASSIG